MKNGGFSLQVGVEDWYDGNVRRRYLCPNVEHYKMKNIDLIHSYKNTFNTDFVFVDISKSTFVKYFYKIQRRDLINKIFVL